MPIYPPYFTIENSNWADSLLSHMSLEEKIGQLFMVAANGKNLNETYYQKVDSLILNYQIFNLYEKIVKKKPIVIKLFYQK